MYKHGDKIDKILTLVKYSYDECRKCNVFFFEDEEHRLYRWNSFVRYPSPWYYMCMSKLSKKLSVQGLKIRVFGTYTGIEVRNYFSKYDKAFCLTRCKLNHLEETMIEHKEVFLENIRYTLQYCKLSEDMLKFFLSEIPKMTNVMNTTYVWNCISTYQDLSVKFILENIDKINTKSIKTSKFNKKDKARLKMIFELRK